MFIMNFMEHRLLGNGGFLENRKEKCFYFNSFDLKEDIILNHGNLLFQYNYL